ncbi:hypothetical protein GCM10014715_70750 [Streptomyces spiralis]|uniref:Uncharacterized protein n=1 Tax=Streptomyces spiralis TaxID=66376 RepID=A0A919AGX5_9ACTN|nr:hypothetical protein GCM10014715_70750 [Streptomyces spiralis]
MPGSDGKCIAFTVSGIRLEDRCYKAAELAPLGPEIDKHGLVLLRTSFAKVSSVTLLGLPAVRATSKAGGIDRRLLDTSFGADDGSPSRAGREGASRVCPANQGAGK